jgi:hypothetical protein
MPRAFLSKEDFQMTLQVRALYTSSNGENWTLQRNRNGHVVVTLQRNGATGGQQTEIDLGTFLAEANQGPQHQALRQLIGKLIESNEVPAEYDDHD